MTMSLVRGLSTIRTARPKVKITKAKIAEWQQDWQKEKKRQRRLGLPQQTWAEYCDNRLSRGTVPNSTSTLKSAQLHPRFYSDQTRNIPSRSDSVGVASKKQSPVYTGSLVKGIAQTHKSNAVPVIDDQHIKDIARMRR